MPYKDKDAAKRRKREWYLKNRERLLAESAEKYKENADEIKAKVNAHYHENRDEIRKRRDELNAANPEQKKRWDARYREANRDKINEWVKANREIVNAWKKRHYKRHGEKVKAYNRSKNNGWEKAPQRMQLWEIHDDAMLFNSELSDKDLAKELGRSVMAVSTRRSILKSEYGDDEISSSNDKIHTSTHEND